MKHITKRTAMALIAGLALLAIIMLTGCQKSASVRANATSSAAKAEAQTTESILVKDGIPVNGTPGQQLAFAKTLRTHAGRVAAEDKLKIPAANRAGFEAALLGDVEHGHLLTKAGRATFFQVTLPKQVEQYQ